LIFGLIILIKPKIVNDTEMRIRLVKTVAPWYVLWGIKPFLNSLLKVCRKTGPLTKAPATMNVAPVSESDRAKASKNAAIKEGFIIGKVTVLEAVKGGAPRVLDARSYSIL